MDKKRISFRPGLLPPWTLLGALSRLPFRLALAMVPPWQILDLPLDSRYRFS